MRKYTNEEIDLLVSMVNDLEDRTFDLASDDLVDINYTNKPNNYKMMNLMIETSSDDDIECYGVFESWFDRSDTDRQGTIEYRKVLRNFEHYKERRLLKNRINKLREERRKAESERLAKLKKELDTKIRSEINEAKERSLYLRLKKKYGDDVSIKSDDMNNQMEKVEEFIKSCIFSLASDKYKFNKDDTIRHIQYLDSIDIVEFAMMVEEEYNINVDTDYFESYDLTFSDLIDCIITKTNNNYK